MNGRSRPARFVPHALAAIAMSTLSLSASALIITSTFGVGVSAQAQSAFNFAAAEFMSVYTDSVHVNINVVAGNTGLGGSTTLLLGFLNYASVRTSLINDQTAHPSADGATSISAGGSINSTTDPTSGGAFVVSKAEAKALGLIGDDATTDGTFTYNSTLAYTFDPNNRAVAGEFDFIGVAEHEISEIMGRIQLNGQSLTGGAPDYLPYDLFDFSGVNTHSFGTGAGRYFSINNGTTNLHGYNNAAVNTGDSGDFDASLPNDPYDAFTGTNQGHLLNATDFATLDVIGWDRAGVVAAPEPGTLALLGVALSGLAWRRRKQ